MKYLFAPARILGMLIAGFMLIFGFGWGLIALDAADITSISGWVILTSITYYYLLPVFFFSAFLYKIILSTLTDSSPKKYLFDFVTSLNFFVIYVCIFVLLMLLEEVF